MHVRVQGASEAPSETYSDVSQDDAVRVQGTSEAPSEAPSDVSNQTAETIPGEVGAGSMYKDEERITSETAVTATATVTATVEVETEHAGDDNEALVDVEDQRVYFGRKVHPQTHTHTHAHARARTHTRLPHPYNSRGKKTPMKMSR